MGWLRKASLVSKSSGKPERSESYRCLEIERETISAKALRQQRDSCLRNSKESSVAGAQWGRERVKDDKVGEAGRAQTVEDFAEHDKDLGFLFQL